MSNKFGFALMCVLIIGSASARDYTIVEKDTYGTGRYYQGSTVGGRTFIASGLKKFEQFDTSNPTNLRRLADTDTTCQFPTVKVITDGDNLAIACTTAVEFYDISEPDSISLLGKYEPNNYAINSIVLEGNRLYMLGGNSEVLVFDATDLSTLIELGRTNVGSVQTESLTKVGSYLYAINSYNAFDIYDVSDAANPLKVGSHPAVGTTFFDLEVIGNFAYLASSRGIQVIDIADKASPSLVSYVSQDANSNTISNLVSLDYDGVNFFALEEGDKVRSIDTSTLNLPVISSIRLTLEYRANDFEINGNSLFVYNDIDGIRTIDISDLEDLTIQDHFTQSVSPNSISLDGDTALIANYSSTYLMIDIDSNLNITERGRIPGYHNSLDGLLVGDTAYVSRNNEISTLDVSDIDNPIVTDTDTLGVAWGGANDYQRFGSQVLIGTSTANLGLFDIESTGLTEVLSTDLGSDPASSTYRGVLDSVRSGDFLYVTTQTTDLTVVDISEPAAPTHVHYKWSDYDGSDRHVEIFGSRLFIARDIGLLVVDISDPNSPQFIELNSDFGLPENIQAIDERYAVINNHTTLYLVDFEDETNPIIIHQLDTNTQFADLAADLTKIVATSNFSDNIKLFQINQSPASIDSVETVNEDLPLNAQVSVTDRENDSLSFTISQEVSNGSLTLSNDGSYSYQPSENYNGSDSFIFLASDEHGGETSSRVDINVTPVNDAPVVVTESITVNEDNQLVETLIARDVENSPLTFSLVSAPSIGSLALQVNGEVTYDPPVNFFGDVQFDVKVSDQELDSEARTVTISIAAVNDAPVATVEDLETDEDISVGGNATATDIEEDTLSFSILQTATAGVATVNPDGSYSYSPGANFNGSDSFSIVANDGFLDSEPVTVNVVVSAINDAPTATNSSGSVVQDSSLSGSLLASDIDGDSLSYSVVTAPSNGTVSVTASGDYTYTPAAKYVGSDSFTFSVSDPSGESATATVAISVTEKPSNSGGGSMNWLALAVIALIGRRKFK